MSNLSDDQNIDTPDPRCGISVTWDEKGSGDVTRIAVDGIPFGDSVLDETLEAFFAADWSKTPDARMDGYGIFSDDQYIYATFDNNDKLLVAARVDMKYLKEGKDAVTFLTLAFWSQYLERDYGDERATEMILELTDHVMALVEAARPSMTGKVKAKLGKAKDATTAAVTKSPKKTLIIGGVLAAVAVLGITAWALSSSGAHEDA